MNECLKLILSIVVEKWEFIVAVLTLIFTVYTIGMNNKIKRQNIFHDLVKEESLLWDRINNTERRDVKIERVLNFYDYLAFLYIKGFIDRKSTKEYFGKEFKRICKQHKNEINKNFNYLIQLRKSWKCD